MLTLNTAGPGSAVYRYACHAHRAAPNSTLLNLNLSGVEGPWPAGSEVGGIHTGLYHVDMAMNSFLPKVTLRQATIAVSRAVRGDAPIHYTSLGVPPLGIHERSFVTIHDSPATSLHRGLYSTGAAYRYLQRFRLRTFRRFPHILTGTEYVRRSLSEFGVSATLSVIPHPVSPEFRPVTEDKAQIRRRLGLPQGRQIVLSVSTNEPRKNLRLLPEMMKYLGANFQLVRVGPPVAGSITFKTVSDHTLNQLYAACDVFVSPSLEEGLGISVAEAMTVGAPVVASDIPALREVAGGAAVLSDPHSPAAFAQGVIEAISLSKELRANGFERSKVYEYSRFVTAFNAFLSNLTIRDVSA